MNSSGGSNSAFLNNDKDGYLKGKLLLASNFITNKLFRRSVVLIVRHVENKVFGIMINKPIGSIDLSKIKKMEQISNVEILPYYPELQEDLEGMNSVDYNSHQDRDNFERAHFVSLLGRVPVFSSRKKSESVEVCLGGVSDVSKLFFVHDSALFGASSAERDCENANSGRSKNNREKELEYLRQLGYFPSPVDHEKYQIIEDMWVTGDLRKVILAGNAFNGFATMGVLAWDQTELEYELCYNYWAMLDATKHLVFSVPAEDKWKECFNVCNIDPQRMSPIMKPPLKDFKIGKDTPGYKATSDSSGTHKPTIH